MSNDWKFYKVKFSHGNQKDKYRYYTIGRRKF